MRRIRVVITGIGVCAPGKPGREALWSLLERNASAISFMPEMEEHGFSCAIGGVPEISREAASEILDEPLMHNGYSNSLLYSALSAKECWRDAGLEPPNPEILYDSMACIYGCGTHGIDELRRAIYQVDLGKGRRLRSTTVFQTMNSGSAAFLSGRYGIGGYVTANSSACATGTESLLLAYERISSGREEAALAGSTSEGGIYVWGGFDALRVLPRKWNEEPKRGSRPLDRDSGGFVPSCGAATFYLETLDSAKERGAHIHAEIMGGYSNCGGQRQGGSMTSVNPLAAQACIRKALEVSGVRHEEVDVINGHLTGTAYDTVEIANWKRALGLQYEDFPFINTFKGHIGHALAASGSLEIAGLIGQFSKGCIYGNANLDNLLEEIVDEIPSERVPSRTIRSRARVIAKASFGFGDVNCCLLLKSPEE